MGWLAVTIAIPLVAPILLMAIYSVLPLPPRFSAKTKLIVPVKDGQLCWVGISFCASAIYEIADTPGPNGQPAWWVIGGLIVALVGCAFFAASGAVFSTPLRKPTDPHWRQHYKTLVWSARLTVVSAVIYTEAHFR
jgi:multisubunit Na+/H+ antiporter MnhB subunit